MAAHEHRPLAGHAIMSKDESLVNQKLAGKGGLPLKRSTPFLYTVGGLQKFGTDPASRGKGDIMIELKEVSKSYDGVRKAVDQLTLDIRDGEIFGFLGPNGAGKTTTLKLITGLLSLDQGSISVNGFDIEKEGLEAKKRLAFVPDNPDTFQRLKGIEYLRFIADIYGVDQNLRQERVEALTRRFGIHDVLNQMIKTYSHGMKQKIILCGALLHDPENWILDEPMTGLDPASSFELKQLMREHADKGKTVLFSTHVLEVAEKVCDRLSVIEKGKLLFVGSMDQLKARYADDASLESLFLRLVREGDQEAALAAEAW